MEILLAFLLGVATAEGVKKVWRAIARALREDDD